MYKRNIVIFYIFVAALVMLPASRNWRAVEASEKSPVAISAVPSQISPEQDVLNATRGQYHWYNRTKSPDITNQSHYERFFWGSIEPRDNEFNTWLIDQGLSKAEAEKGLFGFRIMPISDTPNQNDKVLPEQVRNLPSTWTAPGRAGDKVYIPDWNDEEYLRQWEELMEFLGQKYGNDPRLGWIDIGGYGNWGEWHLFPYQSQYRTNNKDDISLSSAIRIIQAVQRNFPNKWVLLNTTGSRSFDINGQILPSGDSDKSEWSNKLWQSALALGDNVGIRNDSLGGGLDQAHALSGLYAASAYAKAINGIDPLERWKTAPFVTEWGPIVRPFVDTDGDGDIDNNDIDDYDKNGRYDPSWEKDSHGSFEKGLQQVKDLHISWLSADNYTGQLSEFDENQRSAFYEANKLAGYRYTVSEVAGNIVPGEKSSLNITWENTNVAPTYDDWTVVYELRNAKTNETVVSIQSDLDLRKVLPGTPLTVEEVFDTTLLKEGRYNLVSKVIDKNGYLNPMNIGIASKLEENWYLLTSFEVLGDNLSETTTETTATTVITTTTKPTTSVTTETPITTTTGLSTTSEASTRVTTEEMTTTPVTTVTLSPTTTEITTTKEATMVTPVDTTVLSTPTFPQTKKNILPRTGSANNPLLVLVGFATLLAGAGFIIVDYKEQ